MNKSLKLKSILAILVSVIYFQSCSPSQDNLSEPTEIIGPAKNKTDSEFTNLYESQSPSSSPSLVISSMPTTLPTVSHSVIPDTPKTYMIPLSVISGKATFYLTYTSEISGRFLINFENINDIPTKIQLLDQYGNSMFTSKTLNVPVTGNTSDTFSKEISQKLAKVQLFFANTNMIESTISDNPQVVSSEPTPISPPPTPIPTPTATPSPSDKWTVTTLAGNTYLGSANGSGSNAQFNQTRGIAVDSVGNIFVTDSLNNTIRKISTTFYVTTFAGSGTSGSVDGTGTMAQFNTPIGICIDTSDNIYVSDANNNRIRKITATGVVTTLAGGALGDIDGIGSSAQFNYPTGMSLDSYGNIYVTDSKNNKIKKISQSGVVTTIAGTGTIGFFNGATSLLSQFYSPTGLALDSAGNIYVADSGNDAIRKITSGGIVTTIAGTTNGYLDSTGLSAQFNYPTGLALDSANNIYVADANNNRIRKITFNGVVTTIAGNGSSGDIDGLGTVANFDTPSGIIINRSGVIFISSANKIKKITPN